MKKALKKWTSLCLIFAFCISLSAPIVSAESVTDQSAIIDQTVQINYEFMQSIPDSGNVVSTVSTQDSSNDFTISLHMDENGTYIGSGSILLESGNVEYIATGDLYEFELSSGSIAYVGSIFCAIDEHQYLSLSIHSKPDSEQLFVLANVSLMDDDGLIYANKVYAYGDLFDEMNELVTLYENETSVDLNDYVETEDENEDDNISTLSVLTSDYNTQYVSTVYTAYGTSSGGYYPLIALSVFAPKALHPNGTHYLYGKINSNISNAISYAGKYLTIGTVTGMSVSSGTLTITALRKDLGFTQQTPTTKTFNVKIPVPKVTSFVTNQFSITTYTLPIYRIEAELSQYGSYNSSSLVTNRAYWYFAKNNNISWSSSVHPSQTEKAYVGQAYLVNFDNVSTETTCNITFAATLTYSYTSQYGAIQYTGSFNANAAYIYSITLATS